MVIDDIVKSKPPCAKR